MAAQETLLNGRYRLINQQAAGGMAVVYKAQDLALGRTVAIKVLRPSLTNDPTFLARFRQEARNVANLAHPNIVTVHDFGQDGNTYYIVMEFVEGQDLKKLIRAEAPFSVERALDIAIQICAGVGYAHRAGLVHADVKPQNVLIAPDDRVKVTDFGIAQALSATQPQEKQSVVWGSPHYFAPEQASGDLPTPASDVYSIGIVMFEMLTAKLPYNGVDQQELALAHIRDTVPHVMDYNPRVPVHLDRIIYRTMSKDPAARFRSADQLGNILISYKKQGNEQTINQPVNPPSNAPTPGVPAGVSVSPQAPVISNLQGQPPPAITSQPAVPPRPVSPPPAYNPGIQQQPPAQQVGQQAVRPAGSTGPYVPPMQPSYGQPQGGQPAQQFYGQGQIPPSYAQTGYTPADVFNPAQKANSQPLNANPSYQITPPPAAIDLVTVILGVIALMAVLGVLVLWLVVIGTYARG